jgi:large subunit ribosomal protein L11
MEILKPPIGYLLKQAAGIQRASMAGGHITSGIVSLKHIYEIAKFKQQDINCAHMDLREMCIKVINSANRAGIKVVKHDIDPSEMKEFLEKRRLIEEAEKKDLADRKAAKQMRGTLLFLAFYF